MTLSMNEIQTLAAKDARGACAPPAQAAQFGAAAAAHLVARRNAADLSAALGSLPQGLILTLPLVIARIVEPARDGLATGAVPEDGIVLAVSNAACCRIWRG